MVNASPIPRPRSEKFWQEWFAPLMLSLWVIVPELRRVIDWQIGFNSLSVINLVPILALLPLFVVCIVRSKKTSIALDFMPMLWLWLVGFGYAALVGFLSGSLFAAAYEAALFGLPLLVGIWLAGMTSEQSRRVFDRFAGAALWLGVVTSLYGIYQFIAPPPWDVAWVIDSELASIGSPEPFGLRIFGTMNAPGILADFLAVTMLLTIPRLRAKSLWLIAPLFVIAVALVLTFIRTAWLELVIGLIIYLALSPRRGMAMMTIGATGLLTILLATNLSLITGDPTSNGQLISRISSFNNLQSDDSANARSEESSVAIRQSFAEPLGQGLGTIGTAAKLGQSASNVVLDNGYLTRFLEMGLFGFICYLLALATGLFISFTKLRAAVSMKDDKTASLLATCIAIQVALAGAELSGDQHFGITGVLFWVIVGFSASVRSEQSSLSLSGRANTEPDSFMGRTLRV